MYQIIGDNDLKQKASQQSLDSTGADHWFHMCAVLDRVDGMNLDIDEPKADITSLPLQTFLPSAEDCDFLKNLQFCYPTHLLISYGFCIPTSLAFQITFLINIQQNPAKNLMLCFEIK